MSTPSWGVYLCRYAQLPDKRLRDRLVTSLDALANQPTQSLAEALGDPGAVDALYAFWNNPRLTATQVIDVGQRDTAEQIRPLARILSIQDTMELDYTAHPSTQGLGPLTCKHCRGFFVHSVLAVTVDGVSLGLLAQQTWTRDPETVGHSEQRRQRAFAEKESVKWAIGLQATEQGVPPHVQVITIADREADIYDLFAAPRRPGSELLIRLVQNRRITAATAPETRYLHDAVRARPECGRFTLAVGRRGDQPPREATLAVQYVTLAVHPPRHRAQYTTQGAITIQVVLAQEVDPPAGVEPIRWLLGTTLPVTSFAEAREVIRYYSRRWLVERFHYTLKSGCRIEALQLHTVTALQCALATYSLVACRLLALTYQARVTPQAAADTELTTEEWQVLHLMTQPTPVPETPPTLAEAVKQLAGLGGHRGYRSAGAPGVTVLWRGYQRLHAMVIFYQHCRQRIPGFHLGLLTETIHAPPLPYGT